MNLVALSGLTSNDIEAIFARARGDEPSCRITGTVAWSFEGPGLRTRASFLQALRELGLAVTELPDLLKTRERLEDLAGYLDPFFRLYVIRCADHERMLAFAQASSRPVVNAMSSHGHPCEVLTDAFYIDQSVRPLRDARIVLWGPMTNVFRSWHELAHVMGLTVVQVCEEHHHEGGAPVTFASEPPANADVVITDFSPAAGQLPAKPLSEAHLRQMGDPVLLPTPPFEVGRELLVDPARHLRFAGHAQKALLVPVQKAIVCHALAVA